ncbi:hypothetical protein EJB05_12536, partial [Eragrostis curvula]
MATFITVVKLLRRYKETAIWIHLLVMFFALLALLSLMIAAFVHVNIKLVDDGPPRSTIDDYEALVKPQPVREYSLGDYGGRLRRRVADPRYWARISGCIHHGNACSGMSPLFRDPNTGAFLANRTSNKYPGDPGLSPIESGCCKPPLSCGFTYVNQTTWTVPGVPTPTMTAADGAMTSKSFASSAIHARQASSPTTSRGPGPILSSSLLSLRSCTLFCTRFR